MKKNSGILLTGLWVMFGVCAPLSIYLFFHNSVLATVCVVLAALSFGGIMYLGQDAMENGEEGQGDWRGRDRPDDQ